MNTLLHLTGVLSSLWASIFAFQTLNEQALGGALLVLFFAFAVMTIAALDDDLFLITGRKILGFRGDQREPISNVSKMAAVVTIVLLFISTFNVTGAQAQAVDIKSPLTAFGELSNAEHSATVQIDFPYSVNPRTAVTLSAGTGSVSVVNTLATVSTGSTSGSDVLFSTLRNAKYFMGQGLQARVSVAFQDTGTADTSAIAGYGGEEDFLGYGFNGPTFSILHRADGKLEHQTLTITTGAVTSGGTITINLDGVGTEVEVVNGDSLQSVVRAIDAVSFGMWESQAIGTTVVFISHTSGDKTGTFSLVDTDTTGVVGSFAESILGAAAVNTWISQVDWNVDTMDGDNDTANPSGMNLDQGKGNTYEVEFRDGFTDIVFSVLDAGTGLFRIVHVLKYTNLNTTANIQNPTLPLHVAVKNNGIATDIVVVVSSMSAFTQGKGSDIGALQNGATGVLAGDLTTETPILVLKNKPIFQGVANRVEFIPKLLTFSADGTGAAKATTLRVTINPILGGPVTFSDVSTPTSTVAISTNATSLTGGNVVATFEFGTDVQGFIVDLSTFTVAQTPGTVLVFSVQIDGGTSDAEFGFVWRELF